MKSVSINEGWVLERGDGYVELHVPDEVAGMISKTFKARAMDLALLCRPDMFGDTINKMRDIAFAIDELMKGK